MSTAASESPDIVLIGAGIMSATLGTVLKELEPTLDVVMFETLNDCAQESSQAWNNAGTGHAANCELNYTPQRSDGSIDISRALQVNTEFDISRQLWSHLVTKGAIPDPHAFIESCPHMSFVWGDENVAFLRDRYQAMSAHHCYHGMEYSEDHGEIAQWVPLVMEGRDKAQPIAATRMITGTDIDYGALTHLLVSQLQAQPGFSVHYKHKVTDLNRLNDGRWAVTVEDVDTRHKRTVSAKFVFVGAGGGGAGTPGEIQDPRRARLRRVPGQRHLAALRRRRGERASSRQGLRKGRRGLAADVRAPSRHPHRSTASGRCSSAPTPAFPASSSSTVTIRTCSARSSPATSCRCWR